MKIIENACLWKAEEQRRSKQKNERIRGGEVDEENIVFPYAHGCGGVTHRL